MAIRRNIFRLVLCIVLVIGFMMCPGSTDSTEVESAENEDVKSLTSALEDAEHYYEAIIHDGPNDSVIRNFPEVQELLKIGDPAAEFLMSKFTEPYQEKNDVALACYAYILGELDYKQAIPVLIGFMRNNDWDELGWSSHFTTHSLKMLTSQPDTNVFYTYYPDEIEETIRIAEQYSLRSLMGTTFESRSKLSGSTVQIPLTLKGINENIGNMDITLSYDPLVLDATEVTKGDLTADSLFEYNIMAGTIRISLADAEGFSGNGTIAYVTFNVTGATDSTSPLQIAALAANQAEDYEVLTIPTNDGVFRVIFINTDESGGLTISVSDTTGAKGSTVEVPIILEGATEVGSMDIVLNYDANVLSAVDVEAGALGKNALIESNTANDGAVIIALADSSGINGDGAVASVTFEVIGDAGTTSALTLEEVLVHNIDLGEIIPNTVNGTFLAI